jgi:hypothetical protein
MKVSVLMNAATHTRLSSQFQEVNSPNANHDRAWWRIEARRLGSNWPGILRLQAEVVATWRSRHDPDHGRAVA